MTNQNSQKILIHAEHLLTLYLIQQSLRTPDVQWPVNSKIQENPRIPLPGDTKVIIPSIKQKTNPTICLLPWLVTKIVYHGYSPHSSDGPSYGGPAERGSALLSSQLCHGYVSIQTATVFWIKLKSFDLSVH